LRDRIAPRSKTEPITKGLWKDSKDADKQKEQEEFGVLSSNGEVRPEVWAFLLSGLDYLGVCGMFSHRIRKFFQMPRFWFVSR
jgi:hypothetical protein